MAQSATPCGWTNPAGGGARLVLVGAEPCVEPSGCALGLGSEAGRLSPKEREVPAVSVDLASSADADRQK